MGLISILVLGAVILLIGLTGSARKKRQQLSETNTEIPLLTKRTIISYYGILLLSTLLNFLAFSFCITSGEDKIANAMFGMQLIATFYVPLLLISAFARLWLLRYVKNRVLIFDIFYFILPIFFIAFSLAGWAKGGMVSTGAGILLALYELFATVRNSNAPLTRKTDGDSALLSTYHMTSMTTILYRTAVLSLLLINVTVFISISFDADNKPAIILLIANCFLGLVRWLIVRRVKIRLKLFDIPYFIFPAIMILAWNDVQLGMVTFLGVLLGAVALYEFFGSLIIKDFLLFRNPKLN